MSVVECRRLLHTNYNCTDIDLLERWFNGVFDLKTVMRTESEGGAGEAFGIYQPTSSRTVFLYDHRGGRRATSLEMVRWSDPPTTGSPYPSPWDHGIQSVAFTVPDVDEVVRRAEAGGGRLVRRGGGGALLRDPEGVAVEVVPAAVEHPEAHHNRIVCSDLDASVEWYAQLGFRPAPGGIAVPGDALWEGDGDRAVAREVPMVATDDDTFSLIFTGWSGSPPVGPAYAMPFHQGLFRMAIAVDDVQAAYEALRDAGIGRQPPYTFTLSGTPFSDGLRIMFLRDPDDILVELVERPPSSFRR
jgi:catechol 2,3-dioxygenase-like lactoylglutathione lyase family enzyme